MIKIDKTSIVHKQADIEDGVSIGPFCKIDSDVVIGKNTIIMSNVSIQLISI